VTAAVLTPFSASEAVELAAQTWRKKLLPIGEVDYRGRTLRFTRDYLAGLVNAFRSSAYDQVAFQLADSQNTHTNDPDRFRGEVADMELGDDGLYVTVRTTEAGGKVLEQNPKLGVSARIVEDYARSDGRHFPAAIQHVLGTLDPRIPGLGAWQAIEAASPVPDTVIDLSAATFAGETAPAPSQPDPAAAAEPEGTDGMPDLDALTDEQKARLMQLLALPDDQLDALAAGGVVLTAEELDALTAPGDGDEGTDGVTGDEDELAAEIAAMTDEELAAIEAEFEAAVPGFTPGYMPEGEPVSAGLSAEAQFAIDLATARAEETQREMAVISARLREQDYQAEKRKLADLGVPPFITELARPLLEGSGRTVELANGKTADGGQIMRRVLTEYAQQVKLLDLSGEEGSPFDEPEDAGREQRDASREDIVARYKAMTGLK